MMKKIIFYVSLFWLLTACNQESTVNQQPSANTANPHASLANLPKSPASFELAKKILYNDIYKGHNITFYCGCDYDPKSKIVDWQSCGYIPRKNAERASRIEAEHVMPASQFGHFRQCWREPEKICPDKKLTGRQCCEAKDPVFETAHNDLHNLFPAVGEVNGDRSNYNWGMIESNKKEYGACQIEVDESIRRAEPPNAVKGDVARVMFYMQDTYGFKLSDQDRKLYTVWSKQDAPDAWEIERNQRIAEKQGKDNRFISKYNTANTTASDAKADLKSVTDNKTSTEFSCATKKTCGQMANCAEAKFQLKTCGNTSIDKDGDGKPCASLCK